MSKSIKPIDDRFLGSSIKNQARKEYETRKLGTFGPASKVRRIDPKTGLVIPDKKEETPPWE